MKRVIGVIGAMLMAGSAGASERQDALERIGEAVAFSLACPQAKLNGDNMDLVAIEYGIDLTTGSSDSISINAVSSQRMDIYRKYAESAVCLVAIDLFGPSGRRIPNLLIDER
jgi:hypothetical protein